MITIISKRKFGFKNPDPDKDIMKVGIGPHAPKYHEAFFESNGTGELQQAPEWVNKPMGARPNSITKETPHGVDINAQNILTWERAKRDGHIMEVEIKEQEAPLTDLEQQAAARAAEQGARIANGQDDETRVVKTREELQAMTKDELVAYAQEQHGVDLNGSLKKDELVEAVAKAQMTDTGKAA